jgi:signal transduction histidine kinase/CheY-like chemotaxis protein
VNAWFGRLPIHRKLVVMALVVTAAALALATAGLVALDIWRYRDAAEDDTTALAMVVAENTAAAVLFQDQDAARESLASVRVRPMMRRACLYLPDGTLFAGFERAPEFSCAAPQAARRVWTVVAGTAPVTRNDRTIGTVYVERELSDVQARIAVALLSGLVMLLAAGTVATALAHRLHRSVSAPIAELAAAARSVGGGDASDALPSIEPGPDEVGDLVRAFSDMLRRVSEANEELRRKEAEREQLLLREREANRLKDEFLAAVSHELRTPLNAILGWVQILGATTASEQTTARAIASIARNAKAQTRVIEDLVDVSRIATGKLTLRFDPIDLREAVEGAVDAIRAAAQVKHIAFSVELPAHVCLVNGDRDRLQQVVWNLLSNAVKFTGTDSSIAIVTRDLGSVYEVVVSDTGRGIPADFLPYVFDRFRQADGSMTREHGGLGLGLAIVKEITELHGGTVEVASPGPGRGATFTVRLPALIAAADPTGVLVDPEPGLCADALAGVRVLAVDDNQDALDVISAALASAAADVRTASSGAAAVAEWDREPADVLVCDLAMPEMDGYDVLRRIRRRDALAGRFTPAVAISAHAAEEHLARSLRAGFARHLVKPCRNDDLVRAVAAALTAPAAPASPAGSDAALRPSGTDSRSHED